MTKNLLIFLLLLPLTAGAQDRPPSFRGGVTTVLVDALALDSDGNPVSELTAEDFEILEDGVPQTIASLEVTDWTSYVGARELASGPDAEPDVSAFRASGYPRRFVFVLNRQGARFEWLARAKRALSEFVVESLADGDEAMLVEVGVSWKVTQEFRNVKEETLASIRKLSQMRVDYPMGPDRAAGQLYRDLELLAEGFSQFPGRKVLVLMSNELATFTGVGSRRTNEGFTLKRATDALNQANVSVYTIDLRGPESTISLAGGLSPLATETGGRYFRNAIAFETPLRVIGRENARYYLLSYTPTNPEQDGTFRTIEVRSTAPNVEIVARRGYFARPPDEAESATAEAEDVEDAGTPEPVVAPPAASATLKMLPAAVEMASYVLPSANNTARVPLTVALPRELLSREARTLSVVIRRDGNELHRFEQEVDLERYYLLRNVELPPGAYLMEIAVDEGGDPIYQASTAVHVPDGFGDRFGLSSIVPVLSPDATGRLGDDIPILPTTTIARGTDAFLLFQVFAGAERPSRRAYLEYTIHDVRDDEVGSGGKDGAMELSQSPGDGTPVLLRIPMADLRPGRYRIIIRVEDRSRGRRATSEIELRIR